MAAKNQEMASGATGGAYAAEDDVSRKRLRKENGVSCKQIPTIFKTIQILSHSKVIVSCYLENRHKRGR